MRWPFEDDPAGENSGSFEGNRYLLFDSGCTGCTGVARKVEEESEGEVAARSLCDPYAQKLLYRARPEWRWEPTLLEVRGGDARVFTGLSMKARLLAALGPRKAMRLARTVRAVGDPAREDDAPLIGRREALKTLGAAGAGTVVLSLVPRTSLAAQGVEAAELRATELTDTGAMRLFTEVQDDGGGKRLWERLAGYSFIPEFEQAQAFYVSVTTSSGTKRGGVARIPFRGADGRRALIFFSRFGLSKRAGAGIYGSSGGGSPGDGIEVLEVVDGEAVHTQTVANPHASGSAGASSASSYYASSTQTTCDDCCICENVYEYLYAGGCSIGGFFACSAACAPFANVACPAICALVFGAICVAGVDLSVEEACVDYCA